MVQVGAVVEITQQVFEIASETDTSKLFFTPLSLEELALIGGGHATVNTI